MSCQDKPADCLRCGGRAREGRDGVTLHEDDSFFFAGALCRACLGELKEWLRPKPEPTRGVRELVIPVRVEIGDRERAKLAALKTLLEG